MASPPRTLDLEAGLRTKPPSAGGMTRASNPNVQGSPPSARSSETIASGSIHHTARSPVPRNDLIRDAKMFTGDFGQVLLLVVNTGKRYESAVSVPVYRPSAHCARRMEVLERNFEYPKPKVGDDKLRSLLSKPTEKSHWQGPRWKELRWAHLGEAEVDVWDRIKLESDSRRPRWHALLPFWRVAIVEERDVNFFQSPKNGIRVAD